MQLEVQPFWVQAWLIAGTIGAILVGALATVVPMRMGLSAFRALEF
jgi:hypothetical protein